MESPQERLERETERIELPVFPFEFVERYPGTIRALGGLIDRTIRVLCDHRFRQDAPSSSGHIAYHVPRKTSTQGKIFSLLPNALQKALKEALHLDLPAFHPSVSPDITPDDVTREMQETGQKLAGLLGTEGWTKKAREESSRIRTETADKLLLRIRNTLLEEVTNYLWTAIAYMREREDLFKQYEEEEQQRDTFRSCRAIEVPSGSPTSVPCIVNGERASLSPEGSLSVSRPGRTVEIRLKPGTFADLKEISCPGFRVTRTAASILLERTGEQGLLLTTDRAVRSPARVAWDIEPRPPASEPKSSS